MKKVLLGDICDVRDGTHDSPKPKDVGHPLVTSKHIKDYKINFAAANLISSEDFEAVNRRSKVDKYDILISMIGTVGELAFIDYEPKFAIKNIGLIKTGDELLGRYLFYYLQSSKAKQYMEASLAGSTQKFIGLGQLRKFPIELPSIETQQKITEILGAMDEKIELNRKMNETLEQMGQTLFRHYFIDNPEAKKWQSISLDDPELLSIIKPSIVPFDGKKQYVATANVSGNSFVKDLEIISYKKRPSRANMQPSRGSVWFSKMLGEHKALLIDKHDLHVIDSMIFSTGFMGLLPQEKYKNFIWAYINSDIFASAKNSLATGAVMIALNNTSFSQITIQLPSNHLLQKFNEQVENIFRKVSSNMREIQTLSTLRDTLLPRLISGKVGV